MKGNIEFLAENSINAGKQIVSTEAPPKDTQSMGRQSRRRMPRSKGPRLLLNKRKDRAKARSFLLWNRRDSNPRSRRVGDPPRSAARRRHRRLRPSALHRMFRSKGRGLLLNKRKDRAKPDLFFYGTEGIRTLDLCVANPMFNFLTNYNFC